jgi:hypothetical protein
VNVVPIVGCISLGIVIGWLTRYFIYRFKEFNSQILSSVVMLLVGGTVVRFLEEDATIWWYYPIGLLAGFIIYTAGGLWKPKKKALYSHGMIFKRAKHPTRGPSDLCPVNKSNIGAVSSLAPINKAQGNRYWGPFLPNRLLIELGRDALSPFQRPKPGFYACDDGLPPRAVMPSFIALPPGISANENQLETMLTQGAMSEVGVPEVVAILDTGIDQSHPLLRRLLLESIDLVCEDGDATGKDLNGHGTMVALLVALSSPHVQFVNVKVANRKGKTDRARVAQGMREAMARAPSRINLSLGFEDTCFIFNRCDVCKAAASAIDCGSFVFAAPGNTRGRRTCPSRQKGVFTVASYDLRSVFGDASSLTQESHDRLYAECANNEQVSEKALRNARDFVSRFENRYLNRTTDDQAYNYLKSAFILAKEAYRVSPQHKREFASILSSICECAEQFPFDLAPGLVEDLWYHLPDSLSGEQSWFAWKKELHGTSYAVAASANVLVDLPYAKVSLADHSGKGDFVGVDGSYMMVAYEHALLARSRYLAAQHRLHDAITRFDAVPPCEPDDFLELGLMCLADGKTEEARQHLLKALDMRPNWAFPTRMLAQLAAS